MSSPRPPPDELNRERTRDSRDDVPVTAAESAPIPIQHVTESSSTTAGISNVNNGDNSGSDPAPSSPFATAAPSTSAPPTPPAAGPSATSPPAVATRPAAAAPQPGTPSSPNRRRGQQRQLSSVSFFMPFAGQPAGPDGPQVGLTWTLEVFGNDGGEEEGAGPGPNPANEAAPNPEPVRADGAPAPEGRNGPPSPDVNGSANPNRDPSPAGGPGPNPQPANAGPNGQEREAPSRSIFFIVGPDGMMRRGDGAVDDAAAPPFPFPFPFAFPFQPGPPPPDPAKAAELLNSLPTVGRALLKRVDKVLSAEDDLRGDSDSSGWQCGVCLEGIDVGQPVKALPCNHLFHEACLQPWFTNHHHTCPTCRLDLDPLRTLHEPARRVPLRPAATGSGRGTPVTRAAAAHPYARPGAGGNNAANAEGRRSRPGSNAPTQPGTPQNERNEPDGDHLEVPFNPLDAVFDLARMFGMPATASPTPMREGEQRREEGEGERNPQGAEVEPTAGASEGPGAENAGDTQQPAQPPAGDGLPRPTPERRRHITIFHIDHGGLGQETHVRDAADGAAPPAPEDEGAAAREGTPAPAAAPEARAAPTPPAGAGGGDGLFGLGPFGAHLNWGEFMNRGRAANNARAPPVAGPVPSNAGTPAAGTPPAGPAPRAGSAPPGTGAPRSPPPANAASTPNGDGGRPEGNNGIGAAFRFPIELLFFRPPPGGGGPAEEPAAQPENQGPAAPQQTFVPQSLESWTAQREKTLGWRCDAVECQIAPPVPDADTMDVDEEEDTEADAGDKEMLAIYAENQAPFPPRTDPTAEPHTGHEFVLLACPHRWHRACLETAARSAGHSIVPDASGREWIRCARCRKEGWIVPREPEAAAAAVAPEVAL